MIKSQVFLKKGKEIIQKEGIEEGTQIAGIRDLFLKSLGKNYYSPSAQDLFDWEISYILEKKQSLCLYTLLDRLVDILDFLRNDCDDISFEKEEGPLLVALVEERAGDLPIKKLTSLVQVLISKHLI